MNLGDLFQQVTGLINDHTREDPSVDTDGLIGQVGRLFGQHGDVPQYSENGQGVLPASQDPYGDPADQANGGNILPASQDPYGDPADQQ